MKKTAMAGIIFLLLSPLAGTAFPAPGEKPVLYFGAALRFNPIIMYQRYQPMMDYLTAHTPYRFELKIARDYHEAVEFLVQGKTDVTSIGDGGLMDAMLQHGAVPLVKPLNERGKPSYRCYFVVRADSPIRSLSDLRGKSVAFGYRHSTTGELIPRKMLRDAGVKIEELRSVASLRHHSDVVRAVVKGEYDAGAVKDIVAVRHLSQGLRVLAVSEELPSIPLIVRKGARREMVEAVTAALVQLDAGNPQHREIMKDWDNEYKYGFVPARKEDYHSLVRLFKSIPFGCGNGCHR